jgi:class 3 adenylate cyclase/ActR/RegA family two-component response regulator
VDDVTVRRKATVLIVDDIPENIDVLLGILKPYYRVKVATHGERALQLCQDTSLPDLILLDIMMPGMDGFEVCRRLKANPVCKHIPVIFVTAMGDVADELYGFKVGGVDYISKPIVPAIVLARVKTHLQLKSAYHFIRDTFGRYVSDEVASMIIDEPDGQRMGGQKRRLTIMMADIRGFTSICERLPAEHVVEMINIFLSQMTTVIHKYQGTINEFLGDGILANFGTTILRHDHALQAVECAIEMQQSMRVVNKVFLNSDLPCVEMGIGIHTGEAIVGNIGSKKRAKYGVIGQAVNITSRIESHTLGGQILVSDATKVACQDKLTIRQVSETMVKGISAPLLLHDVVAIEGKVDKQLPITVAEDFIALSPPLNIQLMPLLGKSITSAVVAQIVALALPFIKITLPQSLAKYSNVKIVVQDHLGVVMIEDLYAKVIQSVKRQVRRLRCC